MNRFINLFIIYVPPFSNKRRLMFIILVKNSSTSIYWIDRNIYILHNAYIGIMTFIRYKKFGKQEYSYEVKAIWDSIKKKPLQKTKYLGIVKDKDKKIFERKNINK